MKKVDDDAEDVSPIKQGNTSLKGPVGASDAEWDELDVIEEEEAPHKLPAN